MKTLETLACLLIETITTVCFDALKLFLREIKSLVDSSLHDLASPLLLHRYFKIKFLKKRTIMMYATITN